VNVQDTGLVSIVKLTTVQPAAVVSALESPCLHPAMLTWVMICVAHTSVVPCLTTVFVICRATHWTVFLMAGIVRNIRLL